LEVHVQNVHVAPDVALIVRAPTADSPATAVLVRCSGWASFLVSGLYVGTILDQFVDIDVELEEVLPDEVFDELVVVHQLLVVHLGPALQLHFLGIVLPLYFNLF